MTEDEARMRWCPFARPIYQGSSPDGTLCIASACMAWRESYTERGPIVERIPAISNSQRPGDVGWGYEPKDPNRASAGGDWVRFAPGVQHGFCGLAGAPL